VERTGPATGSAAQCPRRQGPVKANEIEAWAAQLERTSEVLSMDAACFREYARLMYRRSGTLGEDAIDSRHSSRSRPHPGHSEGTRSHAFRRGRLESLQVLAPERPRIGRLVDVTGIELVTPCLQSRLKFNLSHCFGCAY
jgi:hypothetical protein